MHTSSTPFRHWVPVDETPEEKAKRLGVPCIPARSIDDSRTDDPNPILSVCGACGLECRKTMMYSCRRANCPMVGLKSSGAM